MDTKLVDGSVVPQVVLESCFDGHIVSFPSDSGLGVRDGAGQSDSFSLYCHSVVWLL